MLLRLLLLLQISFGDCRKCRGISGAVWNSGWHEFLHSLDVDVLVPVPLLLAAMVGATTGTQHITDLYLFFGPANFELNFSVQIVSGPSVTFSSLTMNSSMCVASF